MVTRESALQGAESLAAASHKRSGLIWTFLTFARRKPIGAIFAVLIVFMLVIALAAPVIATHDPVETATKEKLQAPSASHYLGTDELGRDTFSRLIYGARISLVVGYRATLLGLVIA